MGNLMSIRSVKAPFVALTVCGVLASSLMLASPANATEVDATAPATQVETAPATSSTPEATAPSNPAKPAATPAPAKKPTKRDSSVRSAYTPAPTLAQVRAGKAVLKEGQEGPAVKELQKRLIAAGYFKIKATGIYDRATGKAVDGIREKNFMSEGTTANNKVVKALWGMTAARYSVPSICKKQKVALCASKKQKVLRYYKRGKLVAVFDARFGQENLPSKRTRVGNFRVHTKIANGKSDLSGTWMPWALYFSRSQAIHFSPGFRSVGYYGASLGCVNIRDFKGVKRLYKDVKIGTFVKVYK